MFLLPELSINVKTMNVRPRYYKHTYLFCWLKEMLKEWGYMTLVESSGAGVLRGVSRGKVTVTATEH